MSLEPQDASASLALTGGTVVVSRDPPRVERADVLVAGERVALVGPSAGNGAEGRIDCSGCLVVPGNVCAHTHAYAALARGMPYHLAPPTSFLQVLQRIWWRLDRALDEEAVLASARVAAMEALLAGTTALVDHHASPEAIDGSLDVIRAAFESLGLRSVLCYEVSDRDGAERARAGLAENHRFLTGLQAAPPPRLTWGMVGAHASFTLSEETLAACAEACGAHGVGLHVHAAEDTIDQMDALARFGERVVPRLARAGALGATTLLAHAVHLDAGEARLLREAGSWVAHNPRSNMNNRVGRAPLAMLGERVALGTDGIGGDMFEEARTAWLRSREEDGSTGPGWALVRLEASSRLCGELISEPALGRIEAGAPADLVILACDPPTPLAAAGLAGHWGFGLSARHVRDVLVAGRPVVRGGRLTLADEGEIAAEGRRAAVRLWKRMDALPPHPWAPGVNVATRPGEVR